MNKETFNKKIPIQNISDVILEFEHGSKTYLNAMTGVKGNVLSEVTRDNKWVLIEEDSMGYGFYAWHDKESDILYVLYMKFKCTDGDNKYEWVERERFAIDKQALQGGDVKKYFRTSNDDDMYFDSDTVDIAGQFVIDLGENVFDSLAKEIRQFIGGPIVEFETDGAISSINCATEYYEIMGLHNYFLMNDDEESESSFGIQSCNMGGIDFEDRLLPADVKEFINKKLSDVWKKRAKEKRGYRLMPFFDGNISFGIIDEFAGKYVLRCYSVLLNPEAEFSNGFKFRYIEYERIGLTEEIMDISKGHFYIPVIWYNNTNIDNSPFKYVVKRLDKVVEKSKEWFDEALGMYNKTNIILPCAMVYSPFCEKFLNYKGEKTAELIMKLFRNGFTSVNTIIRQNFGFINEDKKALHQMIGLPKCMLNYILDKYEENSDNEFVSKIILYIKTIFLSAPDYLARMSDEDSKNLVDDMQDYMQGYIENDIRVLSQMVSVFGPKNYKSYMSYLLDGHYAPMSFAEYMNKVYALFMNNMGNKFEWKFPNRDALSKADKSIYAAYEKLTNQDTYLVLSDSFKLLSGNWKKYEYEKDGYFITYPKKPEELLNEGLTLKHCVKQFIEPVANGETTILFLRSRKEPEKSYYTVEICNGRLRQCHGQNNSLIKDGFKGMEAWLMEFCKEKNIIFSRGNLLLAAEE